MHWLMNGLGHGGGSLGLARACQEDWVLKLLFDPVW